MRWGLVVALVGAVSFITATSALEWQRFLVADLATTALELGMTGWLALLVAVLVAGASVFGLATGRRALASAIGVGGGMLAAAWLLFSHLSPAHGLELMVHEQVSNQGGFALGLASCLFMMGGALVTRASLPTWDLAMPLPRVVAVADGRLVAEVIAYSPRTIYFSDLAPDSMLPHGKVDVTREGDVRLTFDGPKTLSGRTTHARRILVPIGERASLRTEATGRPIEILVHHIAPPAGKTGRPLLARSEIAAFALLTLFLHGAVFAGPVLGWRAEPKRELPCEAGRCAGATAMVEAELAPKDIEVTIDEPRPDDEEPESTSSKAAGGPEGTFGDPRITDPVVSKVPQRDGPMVERLDPRKVGLLALTDVKTGASDVVAEVLRGDMAATQSKIAAAMAGTGDEFVLGRGTNGLSFEGDGEGGPGEDGAGRIMGQGDIDTGGPNIKTALGDPPKKKRVGDLAFGPPSQSGYCKASAIESVVRRRGAAIRACYEKSLQVRDSLQGKLSVRWTIGLDGKVMNASATSDTLGDPATTQCVMSWVRRMQFEKPEGGLCVVQWPFVFSKG